MIRDCELISKIASIELAKHKRTDLKVDECCGSCFLLSLYDAITNNCTITIQSRTVKPCTHNSIAIK